MKIEIYLNGTDFDDSQAEEIAEELDIYFKEKFGEKPIVLLHHPCILFKDKKRKKYNKFKNRLK